MLTLYRPGTGWVHRTPAGPKAAVILILVLTVSLLPSSLWTVGVTTVLTCICYTLSGLGWRELGRQLIALRWMVVIALLAQVVFLPFDIAIANASRVLAAILIANILVLTTRVTALLDAVERGLRPMARLGVNSERIALVLAAGITTIPVLGRLASGVRESQRARGVRVSFIGFAIPFLVGSLKHADELGEALTARGIR
jgi:biotin transport system permease protein